MTGSPGHLLIKLINATHPSSVWRSWIEGEEFTGEPAAPDATNTWKQLKKLASGGFSSVSSIILSILFAVGTLQCTMTSCSPNLSLRFYFPWGIELVWWSPMFVSKAVSDPQECAHKPLCQVMPLTINEHITWDGLSQSEAHAMTWVSPQGATVKHDWTLYFYMYI